VYTWRIIVGRGWPFPERVPAVVGKERLTSDTELVIPSSVIASGP